MFAQPHHEILPEDTAFSSLDIRTLFLSLRCALFQPLLPPPPMSYLVQLRAAILPYFAFHELGQRLGLSSVSLKFLYLTWRLSARTSAMSVSFDVSSVSLTCNFDLRILGLLKELDHHDRPPLNRTTNGNRAIFSLFTVSTMFGSRPSSSSTFQMHLPWHIQDSL